MAVPYTFAGATSAIPLSQLDTNFATTFTLGNTAIQLGNTVTTLNNMTLANVTISSGNVTITNVSVTTANVTTGNITTLTSTNATITNMSSGNVTITGGTINGTTLGATTASSANVTTLTTSSTVTLNGGTANGIAYLNGSKVLTTGSALTFDGTNLGVGAGSALTNITINGNANGGFIRGQRAGANHWFVGDTASALGSGTGLINYVYGNDPFIWYNGNLASQLMALTSTGLGIGTSSPGEKLEVNGTALAKNTAGWSVFKTSSTASDTSSVYVSSPTGTVTSSNPEWLIGHRFSAQGPLSIWKFDGSGHQASYLTLSSDGTFRVKGAGTAGSTDAFQVAGAAPADAARITSDGDLLVGATSTSTNFDGRLNVAGRIHTKANSGTTALHFIWNEATSGDNGFVNFGTEGTFTSRGSITYNRAGGVVGFNTTSDYRAKDITAPVQNTGAIIDALKIYMGKMKGATIERPMMIAHEAQEVVPYAVTGEKDAVNADGTPKYQQMDHQVLVPLLIAELQSLRARVAALETK